MIRRIRRIRRGAKPSPPVGTRSNVVIFSHTFLPIVGGAEMGIHELATRMVHDADVTVVTPIPADYRDPYVSGEPGLGQPYRVVRYRRPSPPALLGRFSTAWSLLCLPELRLLKALHRERPIDVVNVHFLAPFGMLAFWGRRVLRIPVVLSLVGRADVWRDISRGMRRQARVALNSATAVTENSRFYLDGSPFESLGHEIPYGADVERYRPELRDRGWRHRMGAEPGQFLMLSVCRLSPVKRTDVLLDVAAELDRSHPGRFVLAVIGTGAEERALRRKAADEGISNVRFFGFVDEEELPAAYASADLFVSHSMSETFGIMFAQAMASGLPIVAPRATSNPYVLHDGIDGRLVDPFDVNAFADAVIGYATAPAIRADVGLRNRRRAVEDFDWDVIAAAHAHLLERSRRGRRVLPPEKGTPSMTAVDATTSPARSRFGPFVTVPRRIAWRLIRPFIEISMSENRRRLEEQEAEFRRLLAEAAAQRDAQDTELRALRADLLATNHRVSYLEERDPGRMQARKADG